jgi:hypothetical protein
VLAGGSGTLRTGEIAPFTASSPAGSSRSAGASRHSIGYMQRRSCHFLAARPIASLGPTEDAGRPWPVSVHVRADYLSLPGTQAEATSAGLETLVVSRGTENPASSSSESYKPVPVMIGLDAATPITCSQLSSSGLDRAHPIGLQRVDLSSPCTCWWVSVPFIFPRLSLWRFLRAASQASEPHYSAIMRAWPVTRQRAPGPPPACPAMPNDVEQH